ncbi:MAG TPA: glycosyltransferase family 4 protein [Polyangiaceae bacterium]|jgi:glycosyltransferase involved in cell wall biosynthesis
MRITFVLPPLTLSGGIRVIAIYAERLQRRGHRVVVVTPAMPKAPLRRRVRAWILGKTQGPPQVTFFDGTGVDLRHLLHPPPITDRDVPEADVVIATWFATAPAVLGLPLTKGKKVYFLQGYEGVIPFVSAEEVDATWRLPIRKIVVAEWLRDLARDRFGDDTAVCVPNSVDPKLFFAPPRGKQAQPTIGFIFAHAPLKGTDIAIRAAVEAKKKLPDLRVIAFGTELPSSPLVLPAFVEFVHRPPQPKIRELYAQCDVFLQPSRTDGFGLPILEAMACRTPVVASPAGAAPALLRQGGGKLVPAEDPVAMAAAAAELCALSDADWRTRSDEAYRIATSYSWDDATVAFEAALQRFFDEPRSSRQSPTADHKASA